MPDEIREVRTTRVRDDDRIRGTDPVVSDSPRNWAAQIIYVITGIIVGLLTFRVILSLLGANRGNGFADFIYSTTQPLVQPFIGLFNIQFERGIARLEFETIIAMLVYALIGWALINLVSLGGRSYHYR